MRERRMAFVTLILYVLFSGLAFVIPFKMLDWVFGVAVPTINVWQILFLGNVSSLGFAISVGFIERITRIEKEILD